MKKQTVLGVLLLFVMFCFNAKAEVITVEGASEIANAFFTQSARSQKTQLKSATQLEYAWDSNSLTQSGSSMLKSVEEDPTFYVFNNPDGEGFVIVSGDSNTRSIIGYSYEGNAPAVTDIPLPMQDYLSGIDAEVKYARENITTGNKNLKATQAETGATVVKHLETAIWAQEDPFGSKASNGWSGCVPTAFAIVMRYHEWPEKGPSNVTTEFTGTHDFSSHIYDWSNMPLSYLDGYTEEQGEAVATIMSDLGIAMNATYGASSTDVNHSSNLINKIQSLFGYTGCSGMTQKANVGESSWISSIKSSIDNDCPIPYAGSRGTVGTSGTDEHGVHMFVLDGYTDTNYFHFNWGWSGDGNGWFVLSTMGEGKYQYINENKAYFNFSPNKAQYPVSAGVSPDGAGTVSIAGGESSENATGNFLEGRNITLSATANSGYSFSHWSKDGVNVSEEKNYDIKVATSNNDYVANFVEVSTTETVSVWLSYNATYGTVTQNGSPVGAGTGSATLTQYQNAEVTLSATPNEGYIFNGWTVNKGLESINYYTKDLTILAVGDMEVIANFSLAVLDYVISPSTGEPEDQESGGSRYSTWKYATGGDYTAPLTLLSTDATGNTTYSITESGNNIRVNALEGTTKITLQVLGDYEITGYNLVFNNSNSLTITPENGVGTTTSPIEQTGLTGNTTSFTITGTAYRSIDITSFTVKVKKTDGSGSVTPPATTQYTVTATANPGTAGSATVAVGTGQGAASQTVASGETVILSASANSGYTFVNWTKGGNVVSTSASFTTDPVTADADYVANFTEEGNNANTVALIASAKELKEKSGVGYPNETARTTLQSAIDAAEANPTASAGTTLQSAIDAYYASTDVEMPTAGTTYSFIVGHDLKAYIYNNNGTLALASYTEGDELPETAKFTCEVSDGKYLFKTSDNKYIPYPKKYDGVLQTSTDDYTKFNIIKIVNGGNVEVGNSLLFGKLYLQGKRDVGTAAADAAVVVQFKDKNNGTQLTPPIFDAASAPFGNDNYSSAISIIEVEAESTPETPQFTVTVDATEGGTATVAVGEGTGTGSSSVTVNSGTEVTFYANPADGYRFVNWTKGEEIVSDQNTYTVAINETTTLKANFKKEYTITVSASPAEGGTATVKVGEGEPSSSVTVDAGTNVTITATPADGWEFENWTNGGNLLSTNPTETYPINVDLTLTANFRQTEQGGGEEEVAQLDRTNWSVKASSQAPEEGATNGGEARHAIDNSTTTFWHTQWQDSTPDVPHWIQFNMGAIYKVESFNYVSRDAATTNISGNGNIKTYKLYISDSDISADINATSYIPNGLTPVKDENFVYDGSTANHNVTLDSPVYGQYIYMLVTDSYNSHKTIKFANCADFQVYGKPAYTVSASASEGGSASVSANVIGSGESVTFTASPNTGYNFLGWYNGETKVDGNNEYTATVTSDLSLTAKFAKQTFTVSATADGTKGTASVSPSGEVEYGRQVEFTATANPGYRFVQWSNGEKANPYTTTITANTELTASFEAIPTYTVNVTTNNNAGGTATASQGTVYENETVTLTATPKSGYRFTGWYQNEELVSTDNPYVTTITANTEFTASFEAITTFTVNVTTNGTGGTATASSNSVEENGTVTLTANAYASYRFVNWTLNGEVVSTDAVYTTTAVTESREYVANFEKLSDELLLTFACLSDLHAQQDFITDANNIRLRESATKTLVAINEQEDVDLIVLGGDYTSNNTISQTSWETTRSLLIDATRGAFNGDKTPVIYVNGNHEYEVANYDAIPKSYNAGEYYGTPMKTDIGALAAEDCFYETASNGTGEAFELLAAYHYVVNGFDFVVLNTGKNFFTSASDYSYSIESVQWCTSKLAQICATDKNKTVFFLVHIPFSDSKGISNVNKGMNKGADANFISALKTSLSQYPNLIMLYGHDHGTDSAYIRTSTSERVTEYATNGDVLTQGESESLYYIQNYNTNKYLGYNSYQITTTDTQSSDVTLIPVEGSSDKYYIYLSNAINDKDSHPINYVNCGSSGRFSGTHWQQPTGYETDTNIQFFEVADPSSSTITATKVTTVESGKTYMLVAYSSKAEGYYALTNEMYSNNSSDQRMVGAPVTIDNGTTITYALAGTTSVLWNIVKKPSATDKSFISSFMGSMRYYENSFESGQIDERRIVQALMVYVYSDRVELKMKNYGDEHEQGNVTANGITINQDLTPYVSYRTVTHSAEAVTAAPTITSTGDDVSAGTEVTVTVDAPEWHNLYYTVNGDTPTESSSKVVDGQITFTAIEGENVVKVVAQEGIRLVSPVAEVTYRGVDTHGITVSASPAEGGSASFAIEGDQVTLTATEPNTGYYFVGWSVGELAEIVSDQNTYTTTIVENAAYKANYAKLTYTVTVRTNNVEWGTVNTIANPVTHGETVTLTATPKDGYLFVNWTKGGNQVSTDPEYTTDPVTADVEYIANFQLSVQPEKLTITEANIAGMSHYTFDGGYPVSNAIDGNRNTLFMSSAGPGVDAAFTITLRKLSNVYEIKQYYDPSSNDLPQNAVIEISTDNQQWKKVADVNTSVINDNKEFSCNAGGAEAKYIRIRFLASQDPWFRLKEFEAYGVEIIQYFAVSASTNNRAMGKATMSVAGPTVEEGASVTFTATPYSGYRFVNWTNEGNEVSTDNPYTIQSVTDNINYVANFEKLPIFTVTARSNNEAMGVVTPSSSQVIYGNTATIKAVAKPNYRFVNWTKGTDVVSTNATFTTPIITAHAEYIANFGTMPTEAEKISIVDASTNFATYGSNVIGNIKDGNYSTLFWSEGEQAIGKYVMVDLGALYSVEDIKFYFDSGDKPYGAVVEISTDNSSWTEISTFVTSDLGADNTYVCDAEKKTAQYIRMRINVAGSNWLKLKEFEVYGLKIATSSADITRTTALEGATVKVTTDAPATIKVGNTTYTTTAENLTATITLNATSAETVTIESIGATITEIECDDNATPTEIPLSVTELTLRNVNAGEVEIEAPLLEKITVVSDADDNVATVSPSSDLSQGVQVVVEKEIKTPQTLDDGITTPTIFNFLSMPFAFNTAGIKYWDGNSWEPAVPENHVRILLYDSQTRANHDYKNTWETITTETHQTVSANQGFVIVGNNDLGKTVKLQFTSEEAAYNGSVTSVTAGRYRKESGETNSQDEDWNINGVPYLTEGKFAGDYTLYTYDNSTKSYVSHTPASGLPTLKPYQAVMYQAAIEGEEMTKEIAINSASISNANASENVYARAYISIDDSTPAKIILSDETSENFVVNEDAWYMPSLINTTPALYFNVGGADASVSVQPAANELPMTVYTGAGTSHRISLTATDGNYNVYLKDAATDETVCLNDEDYTFTATAKTTIANRFTVSMIEPTGIIDAARAEGTIKPVVLSNAIKLYGTEEGDQVSLYTANGMLITNAVTEEGVTTIPTSVTGVIIIKVAGETIKVVK